MEVTFKAVAVVSAFTASSVVRSEGVVISWGDGLAVESVVLEAG